MHFRWWLHGKHGIFRGPNQWIQFSLQVLRRGSWMPIALITWSNLHVHLTFRQRFDTVPESYIGFTPQASRITSRALVSWYRISGYERVFRYRCMMVIQRSMLCDATCHDLSPGIINGMYPKSAGDKHREWIKDLVHVQGEHQDPVGLLQNLIAMPTSLTCSCSRTGDWKQVVL